MQLVPQMGEQLPDILHIFDVLMPDPEQAIEVPKILLDDVPMRTVIRDTQLGNSWVEVPTEPVYALAVIASESFRGWRSVGFCQDRVQQRVGPSVMSRSSSSSRSAGSGGGL